MSSSKLVFAPFYPVYVRRCDTRAAEAKNAVLDPVYSRQIDLRREEMFRCLSSLLSVKCLSLSLDDCRRKGVRFELK